MQKLIVKEFGPIVDVELKINDFIIFIGPQASGKSTISKLLYFFKALRAEYYSHIFKITLRGGLPISENIDGIDINLFKEKINSLLLQMFPVAYFSSDFDLEFYYAEGIVLTIRKGESINRNDIIFSTGFVNRHDSLASELTEIIREANTTTGDVKNPADRQFKNLQYRKARDIITQRTNELFHDIRYLTFIPAGRSLYSIIRNDSLISESENVDMLIRRFTDELSELRTLFVDYTTKSFIEHIESQNLHLNLAEDLLHNVLNASYSARNGFDQIDLHNKTAIPIEFASSGQQEALWILLVLFERIYYSTESLLFIEEPEAHLYPEAQKQIAELIALFINNALLNPNGVVITTHSPYFLSAVNNLLYAHNIGRENTDKVNAIVDSRLWIDYSRISAYFVQDGLIRNIMDDELRQIKSEEIDSASRIINNQYQLLSKIEFGT